MCTKTCGEFVSDFKEGQAAKFDNSVRVADFLTAYSYYIQGVKNVSLNVPPSAWDLWINNYCEKNPLDQVVDAAVALIKEPRLRQ